MRRRDLFYWFLFLGGLGLVVGVWIHQNADERVPEGGKSGTEQISSQKGTHTSVENTASRVTKTSHGHAYVHEHGLDDHGHPVVVPPEVPADKLERMIRKLYERGYSREEIIALFKFIDWVIQLNNEDQIRLRNEIKTLEERNKMPYVTSVERIGREEGLREGLQQMVLDALDERFGDLPEIVSDAIHQIQDQEQLSLLLRQAIRSESLAEFQSKLDGN